jgi:hypothetical protein
MTENNNTNPNKIAREERKAEKKKQRLAKVIARDDEKMGIAGKDPYADMKPSEEIEEVTVINPPTSATTYIDATGSKQTSRTVPNQPTFTGSPGAAVINAMSTVTGSNLYDNAIRNKKDVTLAEANAVAERAVNVDKAKEEVEEEKGGMLTSAAMNAIASNPELQKNAQQTQPLNVEEIDVSSQPTSATGGGVATGGATGGTMGGGAPSGSPAVSGIGGVVGSTEPQKPTYEGTATKEQVARDLGSLASQLDFITPDAVMEKLELTDYYPNIGKDIAVGNWTGSVLGSQTIYSGAGGLLPMGLYDARKRAVAKAAKDKQAVLDKMMELPDTAAQFQKNYQDYGFQELINKGLEKYGNYEAMAKSPEWRREFAKFKNLGIELSYADKQADKTLTDLADKKKWVPKDIAKLAYGIKEGMSNDIQDILSGKSDILKSVGKLRSYENGIAHVDELVKEGIFDQTRLSEMPINLKTAEAEANPKDYSDFVRSLSEGSRDNDTFVNQFKRFFDVSNVETLVNNWIQGNNADPSTRQNMVDYMIAQIPNQIVNEYKTMGNQDFERTKLASDNAWRQKEFDLRVQEGKTYYTTLNESMDTPDQNGSTLNDKLGAASKNAKNMTLSEKRKAIKDAFNFSGFATAFDPYSNTSVRVSKPSVQMTSKQIPVAPGRTMVRIQEWDPKKKDFVPRGITIQDLAAKAKSQKVRNGLIKAADGSVYTPTDLDLMSKGIKSNTVRIRPQNLETTKGFVDSKGNLNSLTEFNLDAYNPNMSRNIHKVVGSASTVGAPIIDPETKKQRVDPDTGELMFESLPFKGEFYTEDDISDPSKRTPLDSHFGGKEVKYFKPQGEASTIYSGSSSSGAQ